MQGDSGAGGCGGVSGVELCVPGGGLVLSPLASSLVGFSLFASSQVSVAQIPPPVIAACSVEPVCC